MVASTSPTRSTLRRCAEASVLRLALIQAALLPLPWRLRRRLLEALLGYEIHPSARIGLSIVIPYKRLVMGEASHIGHANLVRGMNDVVIGPRASIGHLNWIYAIPADCADLAHEPERRPELILEKGAEITTRHMIDCSSTVQLGVGALVAGHRSQIITHGIDLRRNRQSTKPIAIGKCSMTGTSSTLLGGSSLPDYSVLGAGSMLRSAFSDTHSLYSGVPAKRVSQLEEDAEFFLRDRD